MKLTATNGNPRNGIYGQRLTVTIADGTTYTKHLPGQALASIKHRGVILDFVRTAAIVEAGRKHGKQRTADACHLIDLFARCKARMVVTHRRVFP